MRLGVRFLLLLVVFIGSSGLAYAQRATLSGSVTDQNGGAIPGVTITLVNVDQGLKRETTSNDEGYFTIPLLQPGRYLLTAQKEGFTAAEIKDIVLHVGDEKALTVELKVGDVKQTVVVAGETPLINESPAVGTVIDRRFVENIPLNGRSFHSLVSLTPGVVITKTSAAGEQGQFSINGQRGDANYFTIDGVSANVGVIPGNAVSQAGGGSLPGIAVTGGTNNLVSVDALQEFKIQTSTYAPEFGRTPGGQVQIITRSGTNELRGTVFEYLRNDKVDATDWFANSRRLPKAALRQNDFGGVLGGPIIKDRTFFFFSFEGLRLRLPQTVITDVPSKDARQTAPTSLRPFLNAFPSPTGPNRLGTNGLPNGFAEFAATYSDPSTLNASSIRLDHTTNRTVTLFGRYNYAPTESVVRGLNSTSLNSRNPVSLNTQTLTLGTTQAITAAISNELRFNYSRNRGESLRELDSLGGAAPPDGSIIFPSFTSSDDAFFTFNLGGGTNSSFSVGRNANSLQRQLNLVDNLSLIKGAHQLKSGLDYRTLYPAFGPRSYSQTITFSSMGFGVSSPPSGSAFSGRISSGNVLSQDHIDLFFNNFAAYAQDTWKIRRRIVMTYGLRWEVNPPASGKGDRPLFTTQGLSDLSSVTLAPAGTRLYRTTYNNFAPRIGIAYQLLERSGRETVIRGGFGIFYDLGNQRSGESATSFPYARRRTLTAGTLFPITDPALIAPVPFSVNPPFSSINGFDPDLKLPRTYEWNVAVEQSLGSNQTITASYVAALGRKLLRGEQVLRPNTNFAAGAFLFVTRSSATSDYHAMQLQFQRRLSRGLQALASYTWAKSVDIVSNDVSLGPPGEQLDPRRDRGPSDFDIRHTLTGAVTYDLPGPSASKPGSILLRHWAIDGILTGRSSPPVNVTYTQDIGFGLFSLRPDLVQGIPLYLNDSTAPGGRRFNNTLVTVAGNPNPQIGPFLRPVEARQGTLGRNALRGFPLWQIDLALHRQFNFSEHLNIQFRAEFFNIFNHPNFADPIGSLTNSSFGLSTAMLGRSLGSGGQSGGFNPLYQVGGPRSIQFGIKLNF